jgi:hypothetical protein
MIIASVAVKSVFRRYAQLTSEQQAEVVGRVKARLTGAKDKKETVLDENDKETVLDKEQKTGDEGTGGGGDISELSPDDLRGMLDEVMNGGGSEEGSDEEAPDADAEEDDDDELDEIEDPESLENELSDILGGGGEDADEEAGDETFDKVEEDIEEDGGDEVSEDDDDDDDDEDDDEDDELDEIEDPESLENELSDMLGGGGDVAEGEAGTDEAGGEMMSIVDGLAKEVEQIKSDGRVDPNEVLGLFDNMMSMVTLLVHTQGPKE